MTTNGITLTIWDCGGQEKLRSTWRYYYKGTKAIIFVVDANDKDRIPEAKRELQKLMAEELLTECSLLVFCNKQVRAAGVGAGAQTAAGCPAPRCCALPPDTHRPPRR